MFLWLYRFKYGNPVRVQKWLSETETFINLLFVEKKSSLKFNHNKFGTYNSTDKIFNTGTVSFLDLIDETLKVLLKETNSNMVLFNKKSRKSNRIIEYQFG